MAGSATFTIVVSRTIMSWARHTTMSASHRRRSGVICSNEVFTLAPFRAKLETASGTKWRLPPETYGGSLHFVKANSMHSTETLDSSPRPRPKRADARRNYDKIVAAAREAFAERGADTSLEQIARRAEVGIGTLYRHF